MRKEQGESRPVLFWGTNRYGGTGIHYAGRVHVVWSNVSSKGLCGLPIEDIWHQRPPVPDNLCSLCCVRALTALYPATSPSPESPPEQTGVIPAIRDVDVLR